MLRRVPGGFRRLLSFAAGSSVGLGIDLGGFAVLVAVGVVPWLSNGISSSIALTAVYLLVTRYSFGTARRIGTYAAFVAWYASVIVASSVAIQLLTAWSGGGAFLWKLASIPVTFSANYCFSLLLFRRPSQDRDSRAGTAPRSTPTGGGAAEA